MLIAEQLAMLLFDDDRGSPGIDGTRLDYALAGAILVELAVDERVRISEQDEPGVRKGRLVMIPGPDPDDPLLAEATQLLRTKEGKKPKDVLDKLRKLSKNLRRQLLQRLVQAGALRQETRKVLGIFPVERWPLADSSVERGVRNKLHEALVVGRTPDTRTAALTSILVSIDQAHKVLELSERSEKRQAKERAKQIAEGDWAGQAVKKALEEIQAAMIVAPAGGGGS